MTQVTLEAVDYVDLTSTSPAVVAAHAASPASGIIELALDKITVDLAINQRANGLDDEHIADLLAAAHEGHTLPPVEVVYDREAQAYWLAEGFHRLRALTLAGERTVGCKIVAGDRRVALLIGCIANQKHGLKRSPADRRKAVATLLADVEWRKQSDRMIARNLGIDHHLVANVRRGLSGEFPQIASPVVSDADEPTHLAGSPDAGRQLKRFSDSRSTVHAHRKGHSYQMKLAPPRPPRPVDRPARLIGALGRLEEATKEALQLSDFLRAALQRNSIWTARRLHNLREAVEALIHQAEQELVERP